MASGMAWRSKREPQKAPVNPDLPGWVWTGGVLTSHRASFLETALTLGITLDLVNDPPEPAFHLLALQPILPPDKDEIQKQQQEQGRGIYQLHSMAGVEGHRERHAFPEKRPPSQLPPPIPLATFKSGLACFLHLCPQSIERGLFCTRVTMGSSGNSPLRALGWPRG